jgi:hypothetical protein
VFKQISSILEEPFIIKPGIHSSPTDFEGLRPFIVFKMSKAKEEVSAENHCTKNRETDPPKRIIINRFEIFCKIFYYATPLD